MIDSSPCKQSSTMIAAIEGSAIHPVVVVNPLSTSPTKWSNTLKQFVGLKPTNCLSEFNHFVGLAQKKVKVNYITCRALLDTGAGSSYQSSALLGRLNIQPVRKETKRIEMMMHSIVRKIDVFVIEINELMEVSSSNRK